MQESLLRLWRRAELFDPRRASLATWLFRIARNLHLDSLRGEPQWLSIEEGFEALDADPPATRRPPRQAPITPACSRPSMACPRHRRG